MAPRKFSFADDVFRVFDILVIVVILPWDYRSLFFSPFSRLILIRIETLIEREKNLLRSRLTDREPLEEFSLDPILDGER